MTKAILVLVLLAACPSNERSVDPIEAEPMWLGRCVDRVGPNLFGPGDVSYRECRWGGRVWVCRLEAAGYQAVPEWKCVAVTRAAPAAPADPALAVPTS